MLAGSGVLLRGLGLMTVIDWRGLVVVLDGCGLRLVLILGSTELNGEDDLDLAMIDFL